MMCAAAVASRADEAESPGGTQIAFEGLGKSLDLRGEVAFYLVNRSDSAFKFYCGVEHFLDGRWQEVLISVDPDAPPKAARLHELEAQGKTKVAWRPLGPSRVPQINRPGRYRFVVTRLLPDGRRELKLRSPEFELHE